MGLSNHMKALVSLVGGAALGGMVGVFAAQGLGLVSQWMQPSDPSAGSVAIVVILTFPLGVLLGASGGCFFASRWIKSQTRRGFEVVAGSRGQRRA